MTWLFLHYAACCSSCFLMVCSLIPCYVLQGASSSFKLVEARTGGSLVRHDLGITQVGPDTSTVMRHFLLAGAGQLQDLHSKLVLDHPRGEADQLHKCIVSSASGRGVFDGNVKVRSGSSRVRKPGGKCAARCIQLELVGQRHDAAPWVPGGTIQIPSVVQLRSHQHSTAATGIQAWATGEGKLLCQKQHYLPHAWWCELHWCDMLADPWMHPPLLHRSTGTRRRRTPGSSAATCCWCPRRPSM